MERSVGPGGRKGPAMANESPFTVDLSCPGTRDNTVTIKTDLAHNTGGLNDLRNTGTCPLLVVAFDASGKAIHDLRIDPGQSVHHFQPDAAAVTIRAVCAKDCRGTARLGYDDPDLVA